MTTGAEPGNRSPAPTGLRAVQRFLNTNDREGRHEKLASPDALADWLVEQHYARRPPPVGPDDLTRTIAIREGLREAAWLNNKGLPDPRRVEEFQRALAGFPVRLRTEGGRLTIRLASSDREPDRALGEILEAVLNSQANGTWPRLKACRRDVCRWVFYDRSRNNSGTWCAMSICGNREKAQRFRKTLRRRASPFRSARERGKPEGT
jgi:predicted RNA-binding Zn ribbon-like protein